MVDFPPSITGALFDLVISERSIAYMEVEGSGEILSIGGEKSFFGLDRLQTGSQVEDHFDFLIDLFDSATLPLNLPVMEMPSGYPADVHIFSAGGSIWILMLSAIEKKEQRQLFRQNINDLSLSRHRQSKILNQYLGKEVVERLEQGIENVETSGERRNLTIMFADIRGFTAYSEKSKSEEVFKALNTYLGAMIPAILEQRGVLDKIIGDEVMAIFGMLEENSDAPNDALSAAIQMLTAVEQLNRERARLGDTQLGVGIGIATGPVSLGVLGSEDRKSITVIGNHVNLAARLQGQASASHLIVDSSTYHAVSRHKSTFTPQHLSLKGYSELKEVYQLNLYDLPDFQARIGK